MIEGIDEVGEVLDVLGKGCDSVRVNPFDFCSQRKRLEVSMLSPVGGCGQELPTRIFVEAWLRASK